MKSTIITSFLPVALAFAVVSVGCMSSNSGDVYTHAQGRTAHAVRPGTIVSINNIMLEGGSGMVGTIAGGVLGGVLGNTIGGGSGKTVAQVGGALAGAAAGAAVERGATKKKGLEIIVQFDDGSQLAVPQEVSKNETFVVGQRVNVMNDGRGVYRVRPMMQPVMAVPAAQ